MGSSISGCKGGQIQQWVNGMPNTRIPRDNGQDQIVWSGNYCCSSIMMASIGENKNTAIERLPWFIRKPLVQKRGIRALAPVFKKLATELKLKQKLRKYKSKIQIASFNVRTLNWIGQLPELTTSAIDHNIDIICIQEHRYRHSEDIKYHDTGNGWTSVSASAWKNSVNTTIGGVGMLIGPQALKSLNSVEKI